MAKPRAALRPDLAPVDPTAGREMGGDDSMRQQLRELVESSERKLAAMPGGREILQGLAEWEVRNREQQSARLREVRSAALRGDPFPPAPVDPAARALEAMQATGLAAAAFQGLLGRIRPGDWRATRLSGEPSPYPLREGHSPPCRGGA